MNRPPTPRPPEVEAFFQSRQGNWYMTRDFKPGWGYQALSIAACLLAAALFVGLALPALLHGRWLTAALYVPAGICVVPAIYSGVRLLWFHLLLSSLQHVKEDRRTIRLHQLTHPDVDDPAARTPLDRPRRRQRRHSLP